MSSKCDCHADCHHHRGKPCPLEPEELPVEWVVGGEKFEGSPISLRRCLMCILEDNKRRRAAEGAAERPATAMAKTKEQK